MKCFRSSAVIKRLIESPEKNASPAVSATKRGNSWPDATMDTKLRTILTAASVHLCIDMQNLYAPGRAVGGTVAAARPARRAGDLSALSGADGVYPLYHSRKARRHARRMAAVLSEMAGPNARPRRAPDLLDLLPELRRLVPPATVIDKNRYSAFAGAALPKHLRDRRADTLIVTGS